VEWAPSATYTVMFTDLVDSTALRARIGDDAADALQHEHHDLVRRLVELHDGGLVKTMGDGTMAAFLGAAEGLACAVDLQQAVFDRNQHAAHDVHVRIGVSLGDGRYEDDDLNGTPVVEAARLCGAAAGDEILCATVVRIVAGSRATQRFTDVGALELKGLPAPVPALRVNWEPRTTPVEGGPPFPAALEVGARIPFIGRRRELDQLAHGWQSATEGHRSLVLISGEPGIGKTRLASQVARLAHAQGATVLFGRCDDELGVPYQPFVEALAFVVEQYEPETFTTALGRHAGELTRLVPGLADHVPGLPGPVSTDPETSQYRLFDAVTGALRAGAQARPILFVIDDLHWAAKPTLLLLRHVAATVDPARVMIVATYRDTDLYRAHPLADVLADLRRLDGVQRISLTGLDAPEVVELLERVAGHQLDDSGLALAQMIYAETEGNPLFTGEVLRHLRDTGALLVRDGRWVARGDVTEIGIPDGVREVIGRRLDRLSPTANTALQVAAVIGRTFDFGVLALLVEEVDDALLAALDEAVDARLVYETGVGQYAFSHALVRSALYDELRPTRRAYMHERVADAIGVVFAGQIDAHLGELAYHYARSVGTGNADRATEFACRAGERALAQLAHDDAVTWFEQARELVDLGGADRRHLPRVLVGLGTAEKYAGRPTFRETLLDAAAEAEKQGDRDLLVQAALANSRGFWSNYGAVDAERVALIRTAIDATDAAMAAEHARLLANLASEVVFAEDLAARRQLTDAALAIAREAGDAATLAHVLIARCVALWHPSTLDERLAHGVELAGLAEELGDPHLAYFTNWYQYAALVEAARMPEADAALAASGELAGSMGPSMPAWIQRFTEAGRAVLAGDLDAAERLAEDALAVGDRGGQPDAALFHGVLLFAIRLHEDRVAEIAELIEQAGTGDDVPDGVDALWGIAACHLGRDDDARAVLDRLGRDAFAHTPQHQAWASIVWAAAVIAAHLGDRARVEQCYDLLLPYAGTLVFPGLAVFDAVDSTLGMLAGVLGRTDAARDHYDRATALLTDLDAPLLLERTRARAHGEVRVGRR
jgi:class 3 adenylate cyclase